MTQRIHAQIPWNKSDFLKENSILGVHRKITLEVILGLLPLNALLASAVILLESVGKKLSFPLEFLLSNVLLAKAVTILEFVGRK
jgi:hypothetical protein